MFLCSSLCRKITSNIRSLSVSLQGRIHILSMSFVKNVATPVEEIQYKPNTVIDTWTKVQNTFCVYSYMFVIIDAATHTYIRIYPKALEPLDNNIIVIPCYFSFLLSLFLRTTVHIIPAHGFKWFHGKAPLVSYGSPHSNGTRRTSFSRQLIIIFIVFFCYGRWKRWASARWSIHSERTVPFAGDVNCYAISLLTLCL